MRIAITGATGFVGENLVNELLKRKHELLVYSRNLQKIPEEWIRNNSVRVIQCSLEELKSIETNDNYKSDVFLHFAWNGTAGEMRNDEKIQLSNIQFTCDAVRLAHKLKCKTFIYAGSIMEYEVVDLIQKKNKIPVLSTIYSTAKLAADFMARAIASSYNMDYISIIISNIYAEGEKSARFLNTIVRKMKKDEKISLTLGIQLYDFIHMEDAIKEISLVVEHGTAGNYYIGNDFVRPLRNFVEDIKDITSSDSELQFGAFPYDGAMLSYTEIEIGKIRKEFGFEPKISFKEGINRLNKWIEEEQNV